MDIAGDLLKTKASGVIDQAAATAKDSVQKLAGGKKKEEEKKKTLGETVNESAGAVADSTLKSAKEQAFSIGKKLLS